MSKAGTQQPNDSHPNALSYRTDSHRLESVLHVAMQISLFSSLTQTDRDQDDPCRTDSDSMPHRNNDGRSLDMARDLQ